MDIENPLLLHIETATDICSVALTEGEKVLAVCESNDGNSHSKNLLPYIDNAMKEAGRKLEELNGVVVSIGPGSYTGLRIGVSTAKGIAYSLQVPVIAVSTLESIASGCRSQFVAPSSQQIIPMIDARRMEVFAARYDADMNLLDDVAAVIVDENTYDELLATQSVVFCGNGMPKCNPLLSKYENAKFADFVLSAKFMLPTALKKWKAKDFADTAYFEPFYLKEYVAAKPHVKGLE